MNGKGTGWTYAREAVVALGIVVACMAWRLVAGGTHADAVPPAVRSQPAAQAAKPAALPPELKPVAIVNGAEITQDRLAAECLARHGTSVLEAIVNRRIIEQACRQAGITVAPQEVDAEIDAISRRFNVPKDKYVELIQRERGVTARQYADDIVWPMVALRRLSAATAEPTAEEIQEAYEKQFGPAVKARIIVTRTRKEADDLRARAVAAPDDFPGLARRHSVDVGSASADGWVQPIRLHSGEPLFDQAAFALQPGQISPVVRVGDQFIIIKCEGHLPAAGVKPEDVRQHLATDIRDAKLRKASGDVFRRLQEAVKVENVLNDPARAAVNPGIAAKVNGQPVGLEQVRSTCLERHGQEVLEILITRKLIEQALARERQQVAQADIDAEIARAAESLGFKRPDGTADTEAWLRHVTGEDKVPLKHYLEDVVWPTVALKKLVGNVPVMQDDLDRAFAATFGPRCKCRVIVLDSQRRAQDVWQMARKNPTLENIGNLAETYSVDPTTKSLRGEVPPIRRWGGQPALEREAFALKAGELSGVVQVADRFMVLFCEGYTEPAQVSLAEVKGELHADLFEKKQRIEMARYFTHLRESAAIDNLLAGTTQSPTKPTAAAGQPGKGLPPSTLTRAEADDLARPRTGSVTPAATPGVVPASLDAPVR